MVPEAKNESNRFGSIRFESYNSDMEVVQDCAHQPADRGQWGRVKGGGGRRQEGGRGERGEREKRKGFSVQGFNMD